MSKKKRIENLEREVAALKACLFFIGAPTAIWSSMYDHWVFYETNRKKYKKSRRENPLLGLGEVLLSDKPFNEK